MLALGGFRIGTLVKLQYHHVKNDLEKGTVPIHIGVEAEITKGKYHDYDAFIGAEAVEYLKAYLHIRRIGTRKMLPEHITSNSPLIRNERSHDIQTVSTYTLYHIIHDLMVKADLIASEGKRRYELRPHSLRKYFRTQLGAISTIPTDFIEYWMGHTISTYNDVRMKGIDYMRTLYISSGLSIRPKTKLNKIEQLKLMIEAWGMNPNDILSKQALTMPHRTIVDPEQSSLNALNKALKHAILEELHSESKKYI